MELTLVSRNIFDAVLHVCANMREADRIEVYATFGSDDPALYADFMCRMCELGTVAWLAHLDGEPIAIVGMASMWSGVVSACMFATDSFYKIGLSMTKFVKNNMIPNFVREMKLHRAQCFSMNGHTVAHAWLEVLGAKPEAVVKGYGKNKEDFTLFTWRFN